MNKEIIESCLDMLDRYGEESSSFTDFFSRAKFYILNDKKPTEKIISQIFNHEGKNKNTFVLFFLLLDEARMMIENDSIYGQVFLNNVESAIRAKLSTEEYEQSCILRMASIYRKANLSVPSLLTINLDKIKKAEKISFLPTIFNHEIEKIATQWQKSGTSSYELFRELDEMMAAMPENMQANFAHHLTTFSNPVFERCGLYGLLASPPLVQEAIVAGLYEKLKNSELQQDTLFYLPIIRGWLPTGRIRDSIDKITQHARRSELYISNTKQQKKNNIKTVMASITDGVGAQNISIVTTHKKKTFVAMVLTKTGFGIKDSFIIPCESQSEKNNIINHLRQESSAMKISIDIAEILLEAALADGIKNNATPAPGFLDIMDFCDLRELRPQIKSSRDLLVIADIENKTQHYTQENLNKILNNKTYLKMIAPITDSWFEDSSETRNIIHNARHPQQIKENIEMHLEKRRDVWATRFLQTALILNENNQKSDQKDFLIASAFALINNQPLCNIPLMDHIAITTIMASSSRFID